MGRHDSDIDLILTDLNMPEMSGRELARHAALLRPKVRVLYMTGYAQPEVMEEMESGKMDFMTKPFNAEMLGTKIREILQRKPA